MKFKVGQKVYSTGYRRYGKIISIDFRFERPIRVMYPGEEIFHYHINGHLGTSLTSSKIIIPIKEKIKTLLNL